MHLNPLIRSTSRCQDFMALIKLIFSKSFSSFPATINGRRNVVNNTGLISTNYWIIFVLITLCTCSMHTNGAFLLSDPYQQSLLSSMDERMESITHTAATHTTSIRKSLQEKAKTFGQSAEEIKKVQYYLQKIQNFEAKQHPDEPSQQFTAKTSHATTKVNICYQLFSCNFFFYFKFKFKKKN